MGITEGSGYLGVAAAAFAAGLIAARSGLRPDPFFVGLGCAAVGLVPTLSRWLNRRWH